MYREISGPRRQTELEELTLARWQASNVFQRALARRKDAPRFTFYEGPPTANGHPGIHHVVSRTLKDSVCRYWDLRGRLVERKAGWDTHGLPVEVEVEKSLKIHGKDAIREYGVESFTRRCIDSVFKYIEEWEQLTSRIGYWLDFERPYVTYHEPYVESVWWALSQLFQKGLLYRGHKVVWWWPQGGTALSSAEVGQGYRETTDPSVTVRFPLTAHPKGLPGPVGKPSSFLAWTTTPWTLPSHCALAVGPDITYSWCDLGEEYVLVAENRRTDVLKDAPHEVVATVIGKDLLGTAYTPPFSFAVPEGGRSYEVVGDGFVTTDSGTGMVHLAPAFGEDDARVCREQGLGFLQLVEPDGTLSPPCGPFAGMYIKRADPEIIRDLKNRGLLFDRGQYTHEYPFCWRAQEDPLIQYARKSWFVRTTSVKDRMLELNSEVAWFPPAIGEGRFGDFLRNNVDWALSRERFWGTPLPIWINDVTENVACVSSVQDILDRNPEAFAAFDAARAQDPSLSPHLRVHKPWIDDITWTVPGEPGVYRRVPDVIDCWFDSGAMPFAQRHHPFAGDGAFEEAFPADFICEGLDQTRGWFYSMLAIGTLLFDQSPYRNVMVNGLLLDKHGKKMSKSVGNTVNPWDIIGAHGADPLRWYLLASSPPWLPKAFDPEGVADVARKVFGTLWPSYNFFAMYASVDGWRPGTPSPAPAHRPAMDRWLLSRVQSLVRDYRLSMDRFDLLKATRSVGSFIVDELSNWYIRRNRARFWKSQDSSDKAAAYDTLFNALDTVATLMAPMAPLTADALFAALHPEDAEGSVHLRDLPEPDESLIDAHLERQMEAALAVVGLGRSAREGARIRVRQPLSRLIASGPDQEALQGLLDPELMREVQDELNVKEVLVVDRSGAYCSLTIKPNLPVLGPRLGKGLGAVRQALQNLSEADQAAFETSGQLTVSAGGQTWVLSGEDLLVERKGREGFAVAAERGYLAALDTTLSAELLQEGLAREVINRLQNLRKGAGLEITQRIRVAVAGSDQVVAAVRAFQERVASEVLGTDIQFGEAAVMGLGGGADFDLGEGIQAVLAVEPVP